MDLSEAIFAGLNALYVADSGAGGLANSTGDQYVRQFVQEGDPNYDRDGARAWPAVKVSVVENEDAAFSLSSSDRNNAMIEMHVFTLRDQGRSKQNAVNDRIRGVYHTSLLATQTGWTQFSPLIRLRGFQAPSSGTEYHYVHQYTVRAAE